MKRNHKMIRKYTFSKITPRWSGIYKSAMMNYPIEYVHIYTKNIEDYSDTNSHVWYDFIYKGNFGLTYKQIAKELKRTLRKSDYIYDIQRNDNSIIIKCIPKFEVHEDYEYTILAVNVLRRCRDGRK